MSIRFKNIQEADEAGYITIGDASRLLYAADNKRKILVVDDISYELGLGKNSINYGFAIKLLLPDYKKRSVLCSSTLSIGSDGTIGGAGTFTERFKKSDVLALIDKHILKKEVA